jgi:hypothetical protein
MKKLEKPRKVQPQGAQKQGRLDAPKLPAVQGEKVRLVL